MPKAPVSSPTPPNTCSTDGVRRLLSQREAVRKSSIVLLLLLGLPALLVGPFIFSAVFWVVGLMWGHWLPWTWIFFGSLAVLVPLLFWTEWRSGDSYYSDAIMANFAESRGSQVFSIDFSDVIGNFGSVNNPRNVSIGFTELFLWGPRQILEAFRKLRRIYQFRNVDRNQSAELLLTLQKCESARLEKLFPDHELDAVMSVAYLVWYDWIGASKENGKVWLESHSRRLLEKQNTVL